MQSQITPGPIMPPLSEDGRVVVGATMYWGSGAFNFWGGVNRAP